jgi:hypothetical protein
MNIWNPLYWPGLSCSFFPGYMTEDKVDRRFSGATPLVYGQKIASSVQTMPSWRDMFRGFIPVRGRNLCGVHHVGRRHSIYTIAADDHGFCLAGFPVRLLEVFGAFTTGYGRIRPSDGFYVYRSGDQSPDRTG